MMTINTDRLNRLTRCAMATVFIIGSSLGASAQTFTPITAGIHVIQAETARTQAQRQVGLMNRDSMPINHGMLFVFEEPGLHCFWMRNTRIPLTIAFVDDDGTIAHLKDMAPMDETSHCPPHPVRYTLEMNQGWFARRGLRAGDRLQSAVFKTPSEGTSYSRKK